MINCRKIQIDNCIEFSLLLNENKCIKCNSGYFVEGEICSKVTNIIDKCLEYDSD